MKTLLTTTSAILVMATTATASPKSCPVQTDTSGVQILKKGCAAFVGANGTDGANGTNGNDGQDGSQGLTGAAGTNGTDGTNGTNGVDGSDGRDGADAVAPLGSLSFAAASASFYGDGVGFGLSDSTYGDLEGSVVFGFDLDNDWRVVVGITTDFNDRHAVSVGVGVSF